MELPLPPLPPFLQPLKLIPYWKNKVAESVQAWVNGSSDTLFGPLDQVVAAVVIIGLALQTPPGLWTPLPPALAPRPEANYTTTPSRADSESTSPMPPSSLLDTLREWLDKMMPSPINLALIVMLLYLGLALVPTDLMLRLRASWELFWPPWQDRSTPNGTLGPDTSGPNAERSSESERARESKSAPASKYDSKTEAARPREGKSGNKGDTEALSEEEKAKMKQRQREKLKAMEMEKARELANSTAKDGEAKDEDQHADTETLDAQKKGPKSSSSSSGEKESQSERSRRAKDQSEEKDKMTTSREVKSASPDDEKQRDKGKQRMEGERPSQPPTPTSAPSPSASKPTQSSSDESTAPSGSESDDPLMAGDYRPLKSALKKSKKKPRQKKNIHHNHLLTMRGHRPHLVPFPHGFHPKPHHPRNTLWFDNIPKNVDHIMAPPPVPKEPEKEEEVEVKEVVTEETSTSEADGQGGTKSTADKKTTETIKKEKVDKGDEHEKNNGGESRKSPDKGKEKEDKPLVETKTAGVKDKAENKDELKAAAEAKEKERAKAKAKAEGEAKAKTAAVQAQSGASSKPTATTSAVTTKHIPVDPQVQKAMYVAQLLLCAMLYMVHEQLGFLLLAFFAYQHIQAQQAAATAPTAARTSPSSSASRKDIPLQSGSDKDVPPEMQEKLDIARQKKRDREEAGRSENQSKGAAGDPRDPTKPDPTSASEHGDTGAVTETFNSPSSKKPVTLQDLTPDQRKRYEQAKAAKAAFLSPVSNSEKPSTDMPSLRPPDKTERNKAGDDVDELVYHLAPEPQGTCDKARVGKKSRGTDEESAGRKEQVRPGDKPTKVSGRNEGHEGSNKAKSHQGSERAENSPAAGRLQPSNSKNPKSLADLTDAERERYLRARSKRKEEERLQSRPGEGSGLSPEEKDRMDSSK